MKDNLLLYGVIAFISMIIGLLFGVSYGQNQQFESQNNKDGEIKLEINDKVDNPLGVTNSVEQSFEESGIKRCSQCLIDMIDLSQIPTNWCSDGRIVDKKPEVDELQNCYCPQLPECVR